jgi:protein-L-isoaspartate(D-aspartate) O-methyltransferase
MASGRLSDSYGGYRARLVEHLREQGIRDLAVLHAFGETPRHLFVPEALRRRAYEDEALPIGSGQTISQPSTQARYLEALSLAGTERVLEVGTGSGYQAALLSLLVSHVVSVERIPTLATTARKNLDRAGVQAVSVVVGDGTIGWAPDAPYDAILVAAASPAVPQPLKRQLREGGQMVIPLERGGIQVLCLVSNQDGQWTEQTLGPAQFVPLVGRHGFQEQTG